MVSRPLANKPRWPTVPKAFTANNIPKKNRMLGTSTRVMTLVIAYFSLKLSRVLRWTISEVIHKILKPPIMPIYGGRWVIVLKIGTPTRQETPRMRNSLRCHSLGFSSSSTSASWGFWISPFMINDRMVSGTSNEIALGSSVAVMMLTVETLPPIHNMMVVTSPMGDHAPPALAATMTMPP